MLGRGTPSVLRRALTADMFSSPPRSFSLPSYAEEIAAVLADASSPVPVCRNSSFDPRVLEFLDVEAGEGDGSDSSSSSDSSSGPGMSG